MMQTSKYELLAVHLERSGQDMIRMTFDEVEQQIRGRLPPAAKEHRSWWANSETHNHAKNGWLQAGYETSSVDMDAGELVFLRTPGRIYGFYKEERVDRSMAPPAMHSPEAASPSKRSRRKGRSPDMGAIVRAAGGVENLAHIVGAIEQYIAGDLLETELGRILRKLWPRI
jgi:hypothetical protein